MKMKKILTACLALYIFLFLVVLFQFKYTLTRLKKGKSKYSDLHVARLQNTKESNKDSLNKRPAANTQSKIAYGKQYKKPNIHNVYQKPKYFYGHNITDRRKDYHGSSFYPELKYHIGVLSTAKFLNTRSKDLYHTWGKEAKSLAIYVGAVNQPYKGYLPVTSLKDVNDTLYPPQRKSFKMIKYWCDNLLHMYDWFVKVDDDTYVKVTPLEDLLWSLDETQKYYIGRPGRGLKHEKHKLGLNGNTFCCGPTVIYSKSLLKDLCQHIDSCLSNVKTPHEDTEIGRCVINNVGVQCADNSDDLDPDIKLRKMFFQTYDPGLYMGDLRNSTIVRNAVSVHEVKHSVDMYNLHYYYRLWTAEEKYPNSKHKSNPWEIIQKAPVGKNS